MKWRLLVYVDGAPVQAVLVDDLIGPGMREDAPIPGIDSWTRMEGAINAHDITIEVRRIT